MTKLCWISIVIVFFTQMFPHYPHYVVLEESASEAAKNSHTQGGGSSQSGNSPGGQAGNASATGNNPGGQAGNPSFLPATPGPLPRNQPGVRGRLANREREIESYAAAFSRHEIPVTLIVELVGRLDVTKNKVGDLVIADTARDRNLDTYDRLASWGISRIVGHVTETHFRGGDQSESRLGIAFDRAILADGSQVSLTAVIRALAVPESTAGSVSETSLPPGVGLPSQGETTSSVTTPEAVTDVGAARGYESNTTGGRSGQGSPQKLLTGASRGVFGFEGLALDLIAQPETASVISSTVRDVKLESGTEMVLDARIAD